MTKNIIQIENAQIRFRNFSGKEGRFNPPGKRNFCVLLDADTAQKLIEDGWNVRLLKSQDPGSPDQAYMQVAVSYDNIPPKIVLITSRGKTLLDETTVSSLDWAEIENVDLTIRPYNWEVSGKSGVKGYVKSMWVTIREDPFEGKYMEVEDSEEVPF